MNGVIIGGGIAGLALAISLKKKGITLPVYESAPQLRGNGLGFLLLPNGLDALEKLGLRDEAVQAGEMISEFKLLDKSGNLKHQTSCNNMLGITRFDLIQVLMSKLDPAQIKSGHKFQYYNLAEETGELEVYFRNGMTIKTDFLLGADGINSRVRKQLFPTAKLEGIREMEIVGFVECKKLYREYGHTFTKFLCPEGGLAMGLLPASPGKLIWYVQFDAERFGSPSSQAVDLKHFLSENLNNWAPPARKVIQSSNIEKVYLWKIQQMKTLQHFYQGNIALLGDAAHPLLPFTSQGVNSAIQDAIALSDSISQIQNGNLDSAFRNYEAARYEQIASYVESGGELLASFLRPQFQNQEFTSPFCI